MRGSWLLLSVSMLAACGSDELPPVKSPPPQSAGDAADRRPPPGQLWRHEVDAVVDAGLGRFLRSLFESLQVEPYLDEHGAFAGWEVVQVRRDDFWATVDLREGDVITAVNGQALERDTQAHDAFVSLKEAEQLVVSLLRDGARMDLVFAIANQPGRERSKPKSRAPVVSPGAQDWPSVDKPMPGPQAPR